MSLFRSQRSWYSLIGAFAALGFVLINASVVVADNPPRTPPLNARGYQITQWQQQVHQVPVKPHQPPAPVQMTQPRFVTIVGPDGRTRTFQIEGTITVVPVRKPVVYFGANNMTGPVEYVPVEPQKTRFGANR
jgi:hypothetical protein